MAKNLGFYRCPTCGYTLEVVELGQKKMVCTGESYAHTCFLADAIVSCCGKAMELLEPNTVEASTEKHLPVGTFTEDGKLVVKVGSIAHPMIAEHSIQWICIAYGDTIQRIKLEPGQTPEATFCVPNATKVDMYAYCNLHGLWKATI